MRRSGSVSSKRITSCIATGFEIFMKIGPHDLDRAVFIVAEVGNNHEGSYARAEEMIGRAKEAGADAVKFQTIIPDRLVSAGDTARIAQLTRFQFSYAQFERLAA